MASLANLWVAWPGFGPSHGYSLDMMQVQPSDLGINPTFPFPKWLTDKPLGGSIFQGSGE